MFSLLSGLVDYMLQKPEYYILILGLDNAGKTTLLEQFKLLNRPNYKGKGRRIGPTIGLNVGHVDVRSARLTFWDLGGQSDLQELWNNYYKECHGIIYVVDSADQERLDESRQTFDKMISSPDLNEVPTLVVCNKQDIEDAMTIADVKHVFNQSAYKLGVRDCKVHSISATNGDNVQGCIDWMLQAVARNPSRLPSVTSK
eukprot:m.109692 g.109692  ORF g.109692 m.109692 type:complete len:200 (-) comp15351_c1_seq1:119-718(-)